MKSVSGKNFVRLLRRKVGFSKKLQAVIISTRNQMKRR